jgi:hypothetical protein
VKMGHSNMSLPKGSRLAFILYNNSRT